MISASTLPLGAACDYSTSVAPNVNYGAERHFVPATRFDAITTLLSWLLCVALTAYFIVDAWNSESGGCMHWFVIPTFLCGVIIAHDLVDWFRGRLDVFDPVGLIGIFGFHWFFFAPLYQVDRSYSMIEPFIRPADYREWLGWMSVLNLLGLLIYRYLRNPLAGRVPTATRRVWILQPARFAVATTVMLLIALVVQIYLYAIRGGITGFMAAFTRADPTLQDEIALIVMFAEIFPILAFMAYVVAAKRRPALASWPSLAAAFVIFFMLVILFGGLRGSRSNTMYQLFWAAGMVHFLVRPIPKKFILVGLVIVFSFAYFYALLYKKTGGLQAVEGIASGAATYGDLQQKLGTSYWEGLLLSEMSRTELQSFTLYQLSRRDSDYELALGRTYYATLAHLIPGFIWRDRPITITYESTEMLYGKGTFDQVTHFSSYVHGIVAEGMLNFGPVAAPFVFLIWTLLIARIRKWALLLDKQDGRLLIAPWLVFMCIVLFMSDSNNMLMPIFKNAGIPFLLVWFCSYHLPVHQLVPRVATSTPANRRAIRAN